jgi:hypothetical protein
MTARMMYRWLSAPAGEAAWTNSDHDVSEGAGYAAEAALSSSSGLWDVSA